MHVKPAHDGTSNTSVDFDVTLRDAKHARCALVSPPCGVRGTTGACCTRVSRDISKVMLENFAHGMRYKFVLARMLRKSVHCLCCGNPYTVCVMTTKFNLLL